MREAGILNAISSLPNEYGIGTLGKSAYEFVDFLKNANQRYWQILPIGHTSFGDSPYQTFSINAGNPYFIDYDLLAEDGLLTLDDYKKYKYDEFKINYGWLYEVKYKVLRIAYSNFVKEDDYNKFVKNNPWLYNYAMFMAIKTLNNGASFDVFSDDLKYRKKEALDSFYKEHKEDVEFWYFVQYEFFKQYNALKRYANKNGIKIIGDIPIYVAYDSCDVWANPSLFQLDKDLKPTRVAGCPPDYFSPKGQLWGNPLYNYSLMKKDNYKWWVERVAFSSKLYDVIRIDHFRGFEAYYSIPYGATDAVKGKWVKGPNMNLFKAINKELKDVHIIAENLGFLTDKVEKMLIKSTYPGMKVLQFAFDPEGDSTSLPHNITPNTVVYTGTHDNPTLCEWQENLSEEELKFVTDYLCCYNNVEIVDRMIRKALESPARLCIIPIQDWMHLGSDCRMNTPSTSKDNWTFKLKAIPCKDLEIYIKKLTKIYRRNYPEIDD